MSDSTPRLYHLVPGNMAGDVLHPLNALREVEPAVYEEHAAKYAGREMLLKHVIPPLGVLWNDVLHLSPVHPAQIRDALQAAGFPWFPGGLDCLEADPDRLGLDSSNACLRHSRVPSDPRPAEGDPYEPYSRDAIGAHARLPEPVADYYRSCFESGVKPLLFQGVTHVLFNGSIPLADGVRIRV